MHRGRAQKPRKCCGAVRCRGCPHDAGPRGLQHCEDAPPALRGPLARSLKREPVMKTFLSSGLAGCVSLAFFACGGADGDPLVAESPAPAAVDGSDVATDDGSDTIIETLDEANGGEATNDANAPSDVPADAAPNPEVQVAPTLEVTDLAWRSCGQFDDRDLECAEVFVRDIMRNDQMRRQERRQQCPHDLLPTLRGKQHPQAQEDHDAMGQPGADAQPP